MIPQHCIEKFEKRLSQYPSIISIDPQAIKADIEKFFSKSTRIWTNEEVDKFGNIKVVEELIEYDPTGIMVYIINQSDIFILTRGDRKNLAHFMISQLKLK